ncbi:type IV pilus assembly protein PilM [Arthrobacter sp. PsM3]|uniref:type IV pilus assembly protein PilM n=1 Tax=Arthrobacter sp. PsM3 TaxID=3030531 RepID=UPI00263A44AC|nr:type IV pilus assembly protein PilM [Arthrobacter sp. PsM3]MDN4643474.1 type IV pilus assembly protein PilM [Arthrobacter sp. PsM3]
MPSRVVGVDIGSTALRAVEVANPEKARPTVLRYFEVPLPVGAVNHGEVADQPAVTAAFKKLWSEGGFKSKTVALGLGNQRVLVRDLVVPLAPLRMIRESLPFQVQDMLPVPVSEAQLDFYPTSEEAGPDGPTANGLLVAARKEALLGNVEAVRRAGLLTVDVDLIPFALTRLLLRRGEAEGGMAVIDVGASTASIVIANDGVPQFVRLIPTGGLDLTVALAARLAISADDAEKLKRNIGLRSLRDVPEDQHEALRVIHELSIELLDSLRNTVTYFLKTRPQETIGRLVLTGGGAKLPGFAEALSEMTRLDVVMADPFGGVGLTRGLGPGPGSMAVALGLAIGERAMDTANTARDRSPGIAPATIDENTVGKKLGKMPKAETPDSSSATKALAVVESGSGSPMEPQPKKAPALSLPKGKPYPKISPMRKEPLLAFGGERRVDLLPTELRRLVAAKKVRERLVLAVVAVLVVMVLGSGAANVAAMQARSGLLAEQAQTNALLAEQTKYLDVRKVQAEVARIKAALRTGASTEIAWKPYLDAVQKTLPGNVTIETVKIDSSSPVTPYAQSTAPLQGARVATLSFSARSPTLPAVPTWLTSIQTLPGFADALPDTLAKNDDGSYTVNITMHINEGAFSKRFPAEGQ